MLNYQLMGVLNCEEPLFFVHGVIEYDGLCLGL